MDGNGLLILCVMGLAVYMGMSWERARRARFDVRQGRKRVANLRRTASQEGSNALLIVGISLVIIIAFAKTM